MKKIILALSILVAVSTNAFALFLDGPKSKCGPLSNAACNDNSKEEKK